MTSSLFSLVLSLCNLLSLAIQDPDNPEECVILIHSLVEGGTADLDRRLRVGDHLVHVNHTFVANKPLEFAVDLLISAPLGSLAVIGVNHPLPTISDISSNPYSPLSRESLLSEGEEFVREAEDEEDGGCGGFFEEGTQSTVMGGSESHHTQDVRRTDGKRERGGQPQIRFNNNTSGGGGGGWLLHVHVIGRYVPSNR